MVALDWAVAGSVAKEAARAIAAVSFEALFRMLMGTLLS